MHPPDQTQPDLFTTNPYGGHPGHRSVDTSRDAARAIQKVGRDNALRIRVLEILANSPTGLTPDDVASRLGENILSIRPRFSELSRHTPPLISRTTLRRPTSLGGDAYAWI